MVRLAGIRSHWRALSVLAAMVLAGLVAMGPAGADDSADEVLPDSAVADVKGTPEQLTYDIVDGMAIYEYDIILGTHEEVQADGVDVPFIGGPGEGGCPEGQQCGVIDTSERRKWPNGVVPYTISPGTSSQAIANIDAAIREWENKTSVRFRPRSNEGDYVEFRGTGSGNTCSSYLGRVGGRQYINYAGNGRGCLVHEIGHAMGLSHEQNRNDRDEYITIDFSNLSGSGASQFRKATFATDVGTYDFQSVMHYGPYSFALDRSRPVIRPIDPNISLSDIGSRGVLTPDDVLGIEFVYGNTPPPPPPPPPTTTTTTRPTTTTTARPTTTTTRPSTTTTTRPPTSGERFVVRARGYTGDERLEVQVNGRAVASINLSTGMKDHAVSVPRGTNISNVRVAFVNDAYRTGYDRNVQVDRVVHNGRTYQSEAKSTYATGLFQGGTCASGQLQTEILHCGGYFQYGTPDVDDSGDRFVVRARGYTGDERLEVQVNGRAVASINLSTGMKDHTVKLPKETNIADVKVAFVNDAYRSGYDRNVQVDRVVHNGRTYQSEAQSTYASGLFRGGTCASGQLQTETLHCRGHFQYRIR